MFHILPNTCIVIQLRVMHHGYSKFTDRVKILHNHKIYQKDYVYLYTSVRDQININFQQNLIKWKDNEIHSSILKLSYYHGRFLNHPKNMCYGLNVTDKILNFQFLVQVVIT